MSKMILQYGTYTHPDLIHIKPSISREFTYLGTEYRKRYSYEISGVLYAADATALKIKIDALLAAYATDDLDLHLYYPDGATDTELSILKTNLLFIRVTQPPQIDSSGAAAVYAVRWPYTLRIEAVQETVSNIVVSFEESFDIRNAALAPVEAIKQPLAGNLKKFDTSQKGACTASQSGRAVGLSGYPGVPLPKWDFVRVRNDNDIQYRILETHPSGVNRLFEVSWSYSFISEQTLTI